MSAAADRAKNRGATSTAAAAHFEYHAILSVKESPLSWWSYPLRERPPRLTAIAAGRGAEANLGRHYY